MYRTSVALLGLAAGLLSCSLLHDRATLDPTKPFDVARMESFDEDDNAPAVIGHEARERSEKERFPGLERLDFIRMLLWPGERSGPCWSELEPPQQMKVRARYKVDGREQDLEAKGFRELREKGWRGIYRTPAGTGVEYGAEFESIDLTVETAYACKCNLRPDDQRETTIPVRLRFRWTGEGSLPEASGRIVEGDRTTGLRAALAPGKLMTYEFPVERPFPVAQPIRCGGTMSVQVLVEPPML